MSTQTPRRLLSRRAANPDGTMTLVEHLTELRNRLIKSVIFIVIGTVVGWLFYNNILHVLQRPYCSLPADRRAFSNGDNCKLLFFNPLDGFLIRLKVAAIAGIILTSPLWIYQLWAFITPGLKKNERKITLAFVGCSTVLFAGGAALAYYTLSKGLHLLVSTAGSGTAAALSITGYLSFVLAMLMIFGVAFEFPLVIASLNLVGILSFERLRKWQRGIIFLVFVFAAIATPSQDPFTMLALAVPMVLLFELATLVAWRHDKRKAEREAAELYTNLPDDQTSPLDQTPSAIDAPESVEDPDPVDGNPR